MPRSDATPLDGMLVHHRVILGPYVAGTHLYTWVKRDKVKLSSLCKETMRRARFEPSASRSVVQGVNRFITHPSTSISVSWSIILYQVMDADSHLSYLSDARANTLNVLW